MAEGVGPSSSEDASVSPLAGAVGSPEDGKPELVVSELDALGSPDFVLLVEDGSPDDGDGVGGGAVVSSHLSVQLAHGSIQRDISVLFVHVVVSSPGLVPEHDSESFDMSWLALKDLIDCKDLSLSTLGLELSAEVIPEFGFGNDFISSEQSDGVYFRTSLLLSGQLAAENEVLSGLELFASIPSFGGRSQRDLGRPSSLI